MIGELTSKAELKKLIKENSPFGHKGPYISSG